VNHSSTKQQAARRSTPPAIVSAVVSCSSRPSACLP
jgi:hypothetical protein